LAGRLETREPSGVWRIAKYRVTIPPIREM
jgi:hypothetical protein